MKETVDGMWEVDRDFMMEVRTDCEIQLRVVVHPMLACRPFTILLAGDTTSRTTR